MMRRTQTHPGPLAGSTPSNAARTRKRAATTLQPRPRSTRNEDADPFGLCGYLQESSDWPWVQQQDDEEFAKGAPVTSMGATRHLTVNFDYSSSDSEDDERWFGPLTPQEEKPATLVMTAESTDDSETIRRKSDGAGLLPVATTILFGSPTRAALVPSGEETQKDLEGALRSVEERWEAPFPDCREMVGAETLEEVFVRLQAKHGVPVAGGGTVCSLDQLFLAGEDAAMAELEPSRLDRVVCALASLLL